MTKSCLLLQLVCCVALAIVLTLPSVEACFGSCTPRNCRWGEWSLWTECNFGKRVRSRIVIEGDLCGGTVCNGPSSVEESCPITGSTTTPPRTPAGNCGRAPAQGSISPAIYLGQEVNPQHKWPWTVALINTSNIFFCGGAIISPTWIITAAHCLRSESAKSAVMVYAGKHRLDLVEPSQVVGYEDGRFVHPRYYSDVVTFRIEYDIALIRLSAPLPFNDAIQPICLPSASSGFTTYTQCFSVGWGFVDNALAKAGPLKELSTTPLSTDQCFKRYPTRDWVKSSPTLCSEGVGGGKNCLADSGGPLSCEDGGDNYVIGGVASWTSQGCQLANGAPDAYTDTAKLLDWIRTTCSQCQ